MTLAFKKYQLNLKSNLFCVVDLQAYLYCKGASSFIKSTLYNQYLLTMWQLDAEFNFFPSVVDYQAVKIDGRNGEFTLAGNIYNFW